MNTTIQHEISGVSIVSLLFRNDCRGWLTELFRHDELDSHHHPVMAYISETKPGYGRGPHEHRDQTDLFIFLGPGNLKLCLWDARTDSPTYCNKIELTVGESYPCRVIVPPGVVHGYRNISQKNTLVLNMPNRLFAGKDRQEPVDEIRHENNQNSPYQF
jgi:dTDP-4-dehydrorhamnose 3,5-epimerase